MKSDEHLKWERGNVIPREMKIINPQELDDELEM